MEPPEGWDPYGRPARRTRWLVSALACHYGLDRGGENEIVVLATGLDQYLQEIFQHLDCAGAGRIPGEDFRTLCQVLGLEEAAAAERRPAGPCSRECYEEVVALEQAEDRIAKLEEENGSLRELVEDMRAALQSSDARCLALPVSGRPASLPGAGAGLQSPPAPAPSSAPGIPA